MIGDTVTIQYNGQALVLNKINQDNYGSEYYVRYPASSFRLKIRHKTENGSDGVYNRHNLELERVGFVAAPGTNIVTRVYTVFREKADTDPQTTIDVAESLVDVLNASTMALVTQLVNWES